jgi:hypothetical protein
VLLQQLLVLSRPLYHMKRAILMLLFALCCSACVATRKDWIVTGGNQANGTVELSYQYKDREVPQIATWLIVHTANEMSPALYLMAAALISGIVALGIRETAHEPLA